MARDPFKYYVSIFEVMVVRIVGVVEFGIWVGWSDGGGCDGGC